MDVFNDFAQNKTVDLFPKRNPSRPRESFSDFIYDNVNMAFTKQDSPRASAVRTRLPQSF